MKQNYTTDDNYISLFKTLEQQYESKSCRFWHKKHSEYAPIKYESDKNVYNLLNNVKKNVRH